VPDYGHDLLFGSFITPSAQQPHAVVGLAQASEEAGLDLVTFQDHPYQPGFLDTWTLLSYVAAATTTVQLAPNVLNVPLRPPAVLARSAASLDLLSGGRFELGLGAGAFWDAIVANGGPRRTPGEVLRDRTQVLRDRSLGVHREAAELLGDAEPRDDSQRVAGGGRASRRTEG